LRHLCIDTLIVGGIVTNGGVASTLRDAHLRGLHTIVLSDGCAAFREDVHEATLLSLASVTEQMTCADAVTLLKGAA
jgi:nicotinamidase-related amidase